jgi:hypothetical protein
MLALAKKRNTEAASFHKKRMKLFLVTCPDHGILDSGKYSFTKREKTRLNTIQIARPNKEIMRKKM